MAQKNNQSLQYRVLINDAEQYSLWLASKSLPQGWHLTPKAGTKEECLAFVNSSWMEKRPRC